jgi:DNA-binding MarR family transcriptional regulator
MTAHGDRERLYAEIEAGMTRIARIANSRRSARAVMQRSGVELGPLAMTTLATIHRCGPARLTQLSEEMGYEPSRVSKELQRLVAGGLVEQARDPSDKRAYLLTVTEKGADVHKRYRRAADELVAEALADWSDDDLRAFARLIGRVEPLPPRSRRASSDGPDR